MKKYHFFWLQDGKLVNSNGMTAIEAIQSFMAEPVGPILPFACSSVKRSMFMAHLKEAIEIASPPNHAEILAKAMKHLDMTPYTNWSGD